MPVIETRLSHKGGIKECLTCHISLEKDENEIGKIEAEVASGFGTYFGEHKDQKADKDKPGKGTFFFRRPLTRRKGGLLRD